jgi:hypothetical protein
MSTDVAARSRLGHVVLLLWSPSTDSVRGMDPLVVTDCPECCGPKTVILGLCAVCFAEFDEWHAEPAWSELRDPVDLPVPAL